MDPLAATIGDHQQVSGFQTHHTPFRLHDPWPLTHCAGCALLNPLPFRKGCWDTPMTLWENRGDGGVSPRVFPMTSTRQTGWTADVIPTLALLAITCTCTFTMLGAATAIRPTQATRTAQGVPRRSRRLQGQPPEFQRTAFKCHFCLRDEESCNPNVVYLPCCKHYVHYNCQAEWSKTSQTCAMCRQPCALGAPTPP